MPIYEYRVKSPTEGCALCREVFEIKQSMDDEALTACPECHHEVVRIISGVSYVRGHNFGDGLTRERLKHSGLKKLVKGDDGRYVDDTPK
jgi:putative FmdB family regulatory protein